jgi:hypothetical protein
MQRRWDFSRALKRVGAFFVRPAGSTRRELAGITHKSRFDILKSAITSLQLFFLSLLAAEDIHRGRVYAPSSFSCDAANIHGSERIGFCQAGHFLRPQSFC